MMDSVISLLNFLGCQELRVSKTKLLFVEKEIKYLGHLIRKAKHRLGPERMEEITGMRLPETKKNFKNFWG
jgi:hypothetical protein